MKTWQTILLSIFIGLIAGAVLWITISKPRGEPIRLNPAPTQAGIIVQVAGAVNHPGVYTLPPGSRVTDGLEAAGGAMETANLDATNLAAPLSDGQKITIPVVGELLPTQAQPADRTNTIDIPEREITNGKLININTATAEVLDQLPGIGESKAAAIVEYREKNGLYKKIDELLNVPGIGPGILDDIKSLITIQD